MEVGVHSLRAGLSRYLALVRRGGTVTVTDRGQVIARIVPQGFRPLWNDSSPKGGCGLRSASSVRRRHRCPLRGS